MTTYTDLEQRTIDALIAGLYAEPGFSDVDADDIARTTGESTKVIRGALSSLIKKGVVHVDSEPMPGTGTHAIYLDEDHYHLHPDWS